MDGHGFGVGVGLVVAGTGLGALATGVAARTGRWELPAALLLAGLLLIAAGTVVGLAGRRTDTRVRRPR